MAENSFVYNELRLEQQLCDAVIRVDGVEFQVHKVILCGCSSYFRSLFTVWSTPDQSVFEIPDMLPDMMKIITEFAYTGSISLTKENVRELFIAADRFDVTGITQACCDFMVEHLTPENCISAWCFTDLYYNHKLRDSAYRFTLKNFEKVIATSEDFLLLSAQQLAAIIENDLLNVKQEERVFQAVLCWISYSPEERKHDIAMLLSNVRLALMSPEYYEDNVRNNKMVKANEDDCRPIFLAMQTIFNLRTKGFSESVFFSPLGRLRLPPAILLAIGGWTHGNPTNGIEAYDVRADRWVHVPNNEGSPSAYHGAVFLNGSVYCVGGFDGIRQFSTMHKFDLGTQTWQEMAPMHSSRCFVSVTVMDGCIYAMGGYDGHDRLKTAERYHPNTNQWTTIAPMHMRRSDACCTILNGKVYICGGFNGNECLATAECYNPRTDQWTLISPMSSSRSGIGITTFADQIFAVGGFDGTNRLRTAEAYNPHTDTWHAVPSMLTTRSNFGIAVTDDRLFVVGGYNGIATTVDTECFSLEAGAWSAVCEMEISRSALSCCVVYDLPNMAEYAAPRYQMTTEGEEAAD